MRLTNQIRKTIVEKMVKAVFTKKIEKLERKMADFIKAEALNNYKAEIEWYKNLNANFKQYVKLNTSFAIGARLTLTPDNRYPDITVLQPFIEVHIKTDSKELSKGNLITTIGRVNNRTCAYDITRIDVGAIVPSENNFMCVEFTKDKQTAKSNTFFELLNSKKSLEKEISSSGLKIFAIG